MRRRALCASAFITPLAFALGSAPAAGQKAAADPGMPRLRNPDAVAWAITEAYPARYQELGVGGVVGLRVFVGPDGVADTITVTSSTGLAQLDAIATVELSQARFSPAQGDAGPVGAWMDVRLRFGRNAPGAPAERVPALLDRAAATADAQQFLPAMRGRPSYIPVSFLLTLGPDGQVTSASTVDSGCFTDALRAAQRIVDTLRFEAAPDPVRHTAVTVAFSGSVAILLRGDDLSDDEDRAPIAAYTRSRRDDQQQCATLSNTRHVTAALVRNYPPRLRDLGIGATVVVWFNVGENGRVERYMIARSSGTCEFDIAAMNVAAVMRFRPARKNGRPTASWVEIPVIFSAQ